MLTYQKTMDTLLLVVVKEGRPIKIPIPQPDWMIYNPTFSDGRVINISGGSETKHCVWVV